jgi:hypothetical protein
MICDCGYNFESALKGIPQTFDPPTTNKWIEGLKFFAWISFVLCIIGGIVISFRLFNVSVFSGLLVIIASFVIAFTGTAVTMIYIGIAEDIVVKTLSF